jgi:hypothetical protein
MDSLSAFARGESARAAGNKMKTFDWDKAENILRKKNPKSADAGLASDYEWTRDTIWKDGKFIENEAYLHSIWATPMLIINDTDEEIECWKWEDEQEEKRKKKRFLDDSKGQRD